MAPLMVTARAGGTTNGGTLGRETVTEETASWPWLSAPLTETARVFRQVTGTAIQHDTAAEAPASSGPESLPFAIAQRTDKPSGGDRIDNGKAANEKASALDGRLALRASTPVISTAWPERHAGALNHGGREDGEQAILAAALETASAAVRDATSGALSVHGTSGGSRRHLHLRCPSRNHCNRRSAHFSSHARRAWLSGAGARRHSSTLHVGQHGVDPWTRRVRNPPCPSTECSQRSCASFIITQLRR